MKHTCEMLILVLHLRSSGCEDLPHRIMTFSTWQNYSSLE